MLAALINFLLSRCLKRCFRFGESLDTLFPVSTAASLYPSNYKVSPCFCRWDATVHIKVEGKRGKITSVAWFNCKQRVQGRVTPKNIACWFRILDKIGTFRSCTRWHLGLRDEETRIFGVNHSRWSGTKDMIFHWHWNTALYFNFDMTCPRPPYLIQVLALPPDNSIRWLKKLVGMFWTYS